MQQAQVPAASERMARLGRRLILLAAFSGGSVPVHLLTREAFQTYADHLKPDGFLIVNITNAYLNLYPVVKRQAEALGMLPTSRFQAPDRDRFICEKIYKKIL